MEQLTPRQKQYNFLYGQLEAAFKEISSEKSLEMKKTIKEGITLTKRYTNTQSFFKGIKSRTGIWRQEYEDSFGRKKVSYVFADFECSNSFSSSKKKTFIPKGHPIEKLFYKKHKFQYKIDPITQIEENVTVCWRSLQAITDYTRHNDGLLKDFDIDNDKLTNLSQLTTEEPVIAEMSWNNTLQYRINTPMSRRIQYLISHNTHKQIINLLDAIWENEDINEFCMKTLSDDGRSIDYVLMRDSDISDIYCSSNWASERIEQDYKPFCLARTSSYELGVFNTKTFTDMSEYYPRSAFLYPFLRYIAGNYNTENEFIKNKLREFKVNITAPAENINDLIIAAVKEAKTKYEMSQRSVNDITNNVIKSSPRPEPIQETKSELEIPQALVELFGANSEMARKFAEANKRN